MARVSIRGLPLVKPHPLKLKWIDPDMAEGGGKEEGQGQTMQTLVSPFGLFLSFTLNFCHQCHWILVSGNICGFLYVII